MTNRLTKIFAAAAAGLVLMSAAAFASPAQSTVSLNVRSGPGTYFHVVDVLAPGERVNVETCRSNGWCFIDHRGANGWVSSNYLAAAPTNYRRVYPGTRRHSHRFYRNFNDFHDRFGRSGGSATFTFRFGTDRPCYYHRGRTICR